MSDIGCSARALPQRAASLLSPTPVRTTGGGRSQGDEIAATWSPWTAIFAPRYLYHLTYPGGATEDVQLDEWANGGNVWQTLSTKQLSAGTLTIVGDATQITDSDPNNWNVSGAISALLLPTSPVSIYLASAPRRPFRAVSRMRLPDFRRVKGAIVKEEGSAMDSSIREDSLDAQHMVEVTLGPGGNVITQSVRIRPGTYSLSATDGLGAIRVEADDVIVDFGSAVIVGNDAGTPQDAFAGVGIRVEGRRNVTIRNAIVRGYHHNIHVTDCENVVIENCDVSRSRGHCTMRHGIPVDHWLEIRDVAFWREYGSGIWMEGCVNGTVRRTRGLGAQNGIVLLGCSHSVVTECDFSFNSGWGIALMKSCDNVISWCHADFVNRYYVGVLGADSAAVAVSDSSHRNCFVGLSMTHGGDGFFLTNLSDLGRDEETGTYVPIGGSDDNVIAYCDGSWSPANAFEGTFSKRCVYYKNFADHSGHGFWLGFSDDSPVIGNSVKGNRYSGISIPDGRGNRIEGNAIDDTEGPAIHLWAEETMPGERFPSTDVEIRGNVIRNASAAFDLANTTDYVVVDNSIERVPVPDGLASTKEPDGTTATDRFLGSPAYQRVKDILEARPAGFRLYRDAGLPMGIEWVQMDDYAPRDFRDALAAYRQAGWSALEIFVLDPDGTTVEVPDWAKLTRNPDDPHRLLVEVGAASARGRLQTCEITLTHRDRRQTISVGLIASTWALKWYDLDGTLPVAADGVAWDAVFAGDPLLAQETFSEPEWPLQPARSLAPGVPANHYALDASTRVHFPAGRYTFAAHFGSGGLRMLVDGEPVLDHWEYNRYGFGEGTVDLAEGEHEIDVRQYKGDGRVRLTLYWSHAGATECADYA